jgi:hypothetical protein
MWSCHHACSRASWFQPVPFQRQSRLGTIQCLHFALLIATQHNTKACSGGDMSKRTISSSFSTNWGSREISSVSTRWGFRPLACQMRRTLVSLMPTLTASLQVLQCVAPIGVVCVSTAQSLPHQCAACIRCAASPLRSSPVRLQRSVRANDQTRCDQCSIDRQSPYYPGHRLPEIQSLCGEPVAHSLCSTGPIATIPVFAHCSIRLRSPYASHPTSRCLTMRQRSEYMLQ